MEDKSYIKFFQKPCDFVLGVVALKHLPQEGLKEVAFWGRSNVGKSSLLNALVNRKNLVRVSNTPGRTKEINFFSLNNEVHLVDLPGYGYAKVKEQQKDNWNLLVLEYLSFSKNLKRIYLLIDAKVGLKEIDYEVMSFLNTYGISFQIILTKIDKISKIQEEKIKAQVEDISKSNPACFPVVLAVSSKKKIGIEYLQKAIYTIFLA